MAYIQFLGAAGTVTGSKHLVNTGDHQALVDCGLFQGKKEWRERNWNDTPIPAREIDAVILTHAHLDHCGWIPRLVQEGFGGRIYATPATIDLCGVVLPDSGHLQEEEAEFHNKHRSSKHDPALPLYTLADAEKAMAQFTPVAFYQEVVLSPTLKFRFVHAAHILGSAMAEVTVSDGGGPRALLFSGDIGRVREAEIVAPGKVVRHGPEEGEQADLLVMESTYGNRDHPKTDPRPELAALIRKTVARGGSMVVPAFAVERTQKFLFLMKEMMEAGEIPAVPVHTDSPMAIKAVNIFLKHQDEFTERTRQLVAKYGTPLEWPGFFFDTNVVDSKKINDSRYPMIIVSSSGMVTGGRVLHHLRRRLPDPRNTVLFIGFQAPGTRGAIIKSGARAVRIFSEEVPIRAEIAMFEQFSDHADTSELLTWLRTFQRAPKRVFLVHGEPDAAQKLQGALQRELHWDVQIAGYMQKTDV